MTEQRNKSEEGGDQVTIKRMGIEDIEEAAPIAAVTAFNPWSKEMIREEVTNPVSHCFLLRRRTESGTALPVGFLCFRQIGEESELMNLCIGPEFRQQGLGKKLMAFYIDGCKEKGVKQYFLEVNISNTPAIHLYHSFGFRPVGTRNNFYQGRHDALLMSRSVS